jgi:linoleoyl-CoA desaturase
MLGSADVSGPPLLHLMTGNLSHQIEHHLFPDLPSNRYAEIAVEVEKLFQRYGLTYHSAPLLRQVGSAWHRVVRLSLPNGWLAATDRHNVGAQLVELARLASGRGTGGQARSTSRRSTSSASVTP